MKMLKTETDTNQMQRRVLRAFKSAHGRAGPTAHFEHGQWWITTKSGAAYSVVDAEGGSAIDGFDFEMVSEGDC